MYGHAEGLSDGFRVAINDGVNGCKGSHRSPPDYLQLRSNRQKIANPVLALQASLCSIYTCMSWVAVS